MSKIDELEDFLVEALDPFACSSIVERLGFVKDKNSSEVYGKSIRPRKLPYRDSEKQKYEQMVRFSTSNETHL